VKERSRMETSNTRDYCVLDIETTAGNFKGIPEGFRLLFVGLKHGRQYYFHPGNPTDLLSLVDFLDTFHGILVTFNGKRFDIPILNKYLFDLLGRKVNVSRHYDILWDINRVTGHRISLAELCRLNLEFTKKTWDHSKNERVWRETPQLLLEYNREDLDLTAEIFEFILHGRVLRVGMKQVTLSIGGI
jgi:uncharacterized protein YprB with RNaseH-like and TPR domain